MMQMQSLPPVSQNRNLHSTLLARIPAEAMDVACDLWLSLIEVTMLHPSRPTQRLARLAGLLFLHALNANRPEVARDGRWRRFVVALHRLALDTKSAEFRALASENADLLDKQHGAWTGSLP